MRKKNSLKNMIGAFLVNLVSILLGLFAQSIFIKILGEEYLGLKSLFSNVISMLSIVELGIGSAIIFNLYKPIVEDDSKKIKSLLNFYRKSYNVIALVISLIGLILAPFLKYIVNINSITVNINIYYVYYLFLLETVSTYILCYKRSLLYANQKNFIINIVHIVYLLLVNIFQITILYFTNNFYLYVIIKILFTLLENIVISLIVSKLYPISKNIKDSELDDNTKKDILKKIKALFFHKIGEYVINGTDNIIISKMLGIVTVGLYSNYYLIIHSIKSVLSQIIKALTPSVGNMLVTESETKVYDIFKKIRFMNFWISTLSAICILVIMDSFIVIWIGEKYVLSSVVLIVLVINYFLTSMRSTYAVFKEAAGIYHEDRYVPIIESILNILFSIVLCHYFGLAGVFMGTIASGLVLWLYSYPKFVYKNIFKRKYKNYYLETCGYFVLFIIIAIISVAIMKMVNLNSIYLNFLKNILVSIIIPNVLLLIIFIKNENFQYYFKMICKK